MKRIHRPACSILAGLILTAVPAASAEIARDPAKAETRLLSAQLTMQGNAPIVNWRFKLPSSTPLTAILPTVNGRLLKKWQLEGYPQADQTSAIVLLADISGKDRSAQITEMKRNMLEAASKSRPNQQVVIGVYAVEGTLIVPSSNDPRDLARMLASAGPTDSPANPFGVLVHSIRTLQKINAERKAIFLFTDGSALPDGITPAQVERLAKEQNVAINIVYAPSSRAANLDVLKRLAFATGGVFVGPAGMHAFTEHPFDLLDSGGRIRLSLAHSYRMIWERHSILDVTFAIGDDHIRLSRIVGLPVASWRAHFSEAPVVSSLLLLLCFTPPVGALVWLMRRSPRGKPQGEGNAYAVFAMLKNLATGQTYSIDKQIVRIGRAVDNDIVVPDETVSRYHAVLQREGLQKFIIRSFSPTNCLTVNANAITSADLADGDVIQIGTTRLRYVRISRGETTG
jgi:hypothetical protein